RVISAEAISGDARSTCCIMPWAAASTQCASANISIAPMIQINARIIVSLYLVVCRPSGCCTDGKWPNSLSLRAIGVATSTINGLKAISGTRAGGLIEGMMTLFLPRCMIGLRMIRNSTMTFLRGARRLGWALVAAVAAQLPVGAAELNDYPTAAPADYVFACMKTNGDTQPALGKGSCPNDGIGSILPFYPLFAARTF